MAEKNDEVPVTEQLKGQSERTNPRGNDTGRPGSPVSVGIYACNDEMNLSGLLDITRSMSDIVRSVKFIPLEYNVDDMNKMDLDKTHTVMLLCHSVNNRRLSITNFTDDFLPKARKKLGKHRVGILVHDLSGDDLLHDRRAAHKRGFMSTQTTAVECSSLVLFGGNMASNPPELTRDQMEQLKRFFRGARDIKKSGMCLPCLCCGLGGKTEYALVHSESTEVPQNR